MHKRGSVQQPIPPCGKKNRLSPIRGRPTLAAREKRYSLDEEDDCMDDFMLWAVPFGSFLCVAAVQGMRKHWQRALPAVLAADMCLAL
jgi:hypothetical protein